VDLVKIQDWIPHNIYVAVADEAKRDHIFFVGHIPPTALPEEAADLGQHRVEHFGGRYWGVLIGASTHESELHAQEVHICQDALAAALILRFKRNRTWQCQTLSVPRTFRADDSGSQYTFEDILWGQRLPTDPRKPQGGAATWINAESTTPKQRYQSIVVLTQLPATYSRPCLLLRRSSFYRLRSACLDAPFGRREPLHFAHDWRPASGICAASVVRILCLAPSSS
jgi:hypothetical protein